jgi:hypothetical protein
VDFKCDHLYRIVFEELIITEPGLKRYLGCQHLARNKDVDVFEDLKIM